jgi:hypothetical protein
MTSTDATASPPAHGSVADSTPYPWPYDGVLDAARMALVVAGHDGSWAQRTRDAEAVAATLDHLAWLLLDAGALVIRVRHRPGDDSPPSPPGRLAGDPRVLVVNAPGIDGFYGSDLDHRLREAGRDHLLLAGHGLEAPVHSTLRAANDRGYECLLLLDACGALVPDLTPSARSMVEMSGGIFGAVGSTDALLAALDLPSVSTPATDLPEEAAS